MRFLRSPRPSPSAGSPPARPWRRRAAIALGTVAGALALLFVAIVVVLRSLDQPWIKGRLQALVRSSAGLDVDYRVARLDLLSGLHLEGLVVRSPAEVRRFAPDLVRVAGIDAAWSLRSLLGGRVTSIALASVAFTVVVDQAGRTSFDALPPSPPGPSVPLSRLAAKSLAGAPPVGTVDVDPVTLTLVRTDHGVEVDRTTVSGLALVLAARDADRPAQGWQLHAQLGSPARDFAVERTGAGGVQGAARGNLVVTVDASPASLGATLDLRTTEQTFAAGVSAGRWLHAEASARFDPAAGRTAIHVDRLEAAEGAATAEASIDLPDAGDPVVREAHGDVDAARLLRWLPPGLLPVTADRAHARFEVAALTAGAVVRLAEGGKATADVDLANLAVRDPVMALDVAEGTLSLRATPAEGGVVVGHASLALTRTALAAGDLRLSSEGFAFEADGRQAVDGALTGDAAVHFARLDRAGASPIAARDGRVALHAEDLRVDSAAPLATRGNVGAEVDVGSLDARSPSSHVVVDGLALRAHTALAGHEPYTLDLEAPMKALRVAGADGRLLVDAPARLEVHAHDVFPDVERPIASRGAVSAIGDLGDVHATVDAKKDSDAADFGVVLAARSLRAIRPFLSPEEIDAAPWDRMALTLRSSGRVERLAGSPSIRQSTELHVERPAFRNVAAQSLALTVRSQGDATKHRAEVELRAPGLAVDGAEPADEHVTFSGDLDRAGPSLKFSLATEGHAASKVAGAFSFDPARRAVRYDVDGHLGGLGPLVPLAAKAQLASVDLAPLEIDLAAHGALFGVVAAVGRDGSIAYQPAPERTAAVEGDADLRLAHVRWARGDTAIAAPVFAWHATMRILEERRVLESHTQIDAVHLDLGSRQMDIGGVDDRTTVSVAGSLANPDIEVKQQLATRSIQQTFAPAYPLGDLALSIAAERGPEGVVHVSDLKLANGAAGTALALTGNIDLATSRRTLSLTTSLTQDLGRLSTIPERFKGQGKLAIDAAVTSPDLMHVHVRATVKGDGVTVALPREGIEVDQANGEVPVTVALEIGSEGVSLARNEKQSPYSMLRFADQHPLLTRSGFLSIAHLKTPFVAIAPLVGNLEVAQNVISLRQFEMGVRGGSITGQCGIDWEGPKSTMELHIRASGVQSSHGEPFDGNIAVVISAGDRSIDGRAEVLRIGERHLLDLLDLQDPQHVDPAINRIRSALLFGYPDKLRLTFDHGFASAHLELGGLARLVSIGELRGIPMGPIVDKLLAPVFEGTTPKETP
jgi:hypothetical protein